MRKEEKRDLVSGILTLAFGTAELILTGNITVKQTTGDPGSAFLPYVVGSLIVVMSLLQLAGTLAKIRKTSRSTAPQPPQEKKSELPVLLSATNLLLYVLLLKPAGFILSSMLYLILQMLIMACGKPSKRELGVLAVIAVAAPVLIYLIFVRLFSMPLPTGLLKL